MDLKAFGKRLAACILVMVLMLSSCLSIAGCNMFSDNSTPSVSQQELVRILISAISNKNNVSDAYSMIPEKQLDGISYSVFNEYVAVLRTMSDRFGRIGSFRILNDKERDSYLKSLLSQAGRDNFPEEYGSLSVVELEYGDSLDPDRAGMHCRFCVSTDENGSSYLSKDYVTDTIASYNYLNHYFTMLEDNNTDGLFALLSPLYNDEIYINSVITAKAEYISEFYMIKVRSTRSEYIYEEISPVLVTVTIPKVIDEDGENITEHSVKLEVRDDGSYHIADQIPWYLDQTDVGVYDESGNAIRIYGVTLNEDRVRALLGDPFYFRVYDLSDEEMAEFGMTHRVIAVYGGIAVTMIANYVDEDTWEGVVTSIRVYSDDYSIDGEIFVGMNISELLLIYPMLDEADYSFTYSIGRDDYVVVFDFDVNNNIRNFSIVRADVLASR